jgi:hypothetical protein
VVILAARSSIQHAAAAWVWAAQHMQAVIMLGNDTTLIAAADAGPTQDVFQAAAA